jgi:hypothetical protein
VKRRIIDQTLKSNDISEVVNENTSQEQAIEQLQTQSENMEVHHHPKVEKKIYARA